MGPKGRLFVFACHLQVLQSTKNGENRDLLVISALWTIDNEAMPDTALNGLKGDPFRYELLSHDVVLKNQEQKLIKVALLVLLPIKVQAIQIEFRIKIYDVKNVQRYVRKVERSEKMKTNAGVQRSTQSRYLFVQGLSRVH